MVFVWQFVKPSAQSKQADTWSTNTIQQELIANCPVSDIDSKVRAAENHEETRRVGNLASDIGNDGTQMSHDKSSFPRRQSQERLERLLALTGRLGVDPALLPYQDFGLLSPDIKFAWMREWPEFADHSDLLLAVLVSDTTRADKLLSSGADPNCRTLDGTSALIYASEQGNTVMVDSLLAVGASPNYARLGGDTALILAVRSGNLQIVKSLIARGADTQASRDDGFTVLMAGATRGNIAVVDLLLESKIDVSTRGPFGWTALMYTGGRDAGEIAEALIKRGASIHSTADDGSDPLLVAASRQSLSLIQVLLTHGAEVNVRRTDGSTALILSTKDDEESAPGNVRCVQILLEAGADPNIGDNAGVTPLMNVAQYGDLAIARALLNRGARIDKKNNRAQTALDIANQFGRQDIAELLRTTQEAYP